MSYQIGLLGVLKECLIPIIFMCAIWVGIALSSITAKDKANRTYVTAIRIIALILPLPWVLFFFLLAPSSSTGWNLQDNILHIEAHTASGDINLSTTRMALVKKSQAWLPVSYAGLHHFYITIGRLQLQNGKTAGVLLSNGSSRVLVLLSNNNYYILSHPGIESLYDELKRRGIEDFTP